MNDPEFVYLEVQDDNGVPIRRFKCLNKAAKMSPFLSDMLEHTFIGDSSASNLTILPVPRKHCSTYAVEQIIKWCEYHCDDPASVNQQSQNRSFDEDDNDSGDTREISCYWDRNFMNNIAPSTGLTAESRSNLYDLLIASHFLAIDRLTDLGAKFLCKLISGKSCEEVRTLLNIVNDFEPDEERILHDQVAWSERAKRS